MEAQCNRFRRDLSRSSRTPQYSAAAMQGRDEAGGLPEAVSAAGMQVLAMRLGVGVCHAGVIDDFWGANFLNSQRSNDSWDNAGHGTGTSCALGCPNDGSTGTGLGIALKAS